MTITSDETLVDVPPDEAVESGPESTAPETEQDQGEPEHEPTRIAVAIGFPVIAAAVMVGGIFLGVTPRLYAVLAGLLGVALATVLARVRKPIAVNLLALAGLFLVGLVMVLPSGPGNVSALRTLVTESAREGDLLRPPVPFNAGWAAILGWLMGIVGFAAGWVGVALRKPSIGLVLPLPVIVLASISVAEAAKVASGIAVLVLFAIGLGLLASANASADSDESTPLSYELRKLGKAIPIILVICVALYFASKSGFLFPKTVFDPTQEPQKPKTTPLSEVEDRVLYEVESPITGPWRIGSLDFFDGTDWRLPPFAESELQEVPRSGIVDESLKPGVRATFTIAGLEGAVLPGLPNTVGIIAEGPKLAYDDRTGNIRVSQGQVRAGLKYTVVAAALPSIEELQKITTSFPPSEQKRFAEMPIDPPPAAAALIRQAPKTSKWDEFDYLRNYILDNVVASGPGVPKSIGADRIEDMIAGSKEGSPYEIVAAQAMFARWIGVPARIGYGFDGGDAVEGKLQVRPKHGATFVEVYFPGYGWLPVIGTPRQAEPSVGDTAQQQFDPTIEPSNEIAVQLYLPVLIPPRGVFFEQVRNIVLVVVPVLLLIALAYFVWPAIRKAFVRSRRRSAAAAAGPRARIALAYAEWRDFATDYGFQHSTDTPLMFLDRFVEDPEHTELAWLVTRALWGDLQPHVSPEMASIAEELSRALRRRLAQAQPATVRMVAAVSRLSLRRPYAPETDLTRRAERTRKEAELATASA